MTALERIGSLEIQVPTRPQLEWINYSLISVSFVAEAFEIAKYGKEIPLRATVSKQIENNQDYYAVNFRNIVAHTGNISLANDVSNSINKLYDSNIYKELRPIFVENVELALTGVELRQKLLTLRIKVRAGVPLQGSCLAGREADPRLE